MNRLDDVAAVPEARAHESLRPEQGDRRIDVRPGARRGAERRDRQWPAGDGDHLDELAGTSRQTFEPVADHLVESDGTERRPVGARIVAMAAHELLDQQRAPARLAYHRPCGSPSRLVGRSEQREGHAVGIVGRERPHLDVQDPGRGRPGRGHLDQEWAAGRLAAAVRHHEEERGRVRGTRQLHQQRDAVDVAPLCVVDEHHQRLALRERGEQIAEGDERAPAYSLRIVAGLVPAPADARDPLQDGKHTSQGRHVDRQRERFALFLEEHQMAAERIDGAVDRLVRDRLTLVSPPAENERFPALREAVEEVLHDRGFAHPRHTGEAHGHLHARSSAVEGLAERAELLLAPDECRRQVRCGGRRGHPATRSEPAQDLPRRRAHGRIAAQ